jgi:hypothetical protein
MEEHISGGGFLDRFLNLLRLLGRRRRRRRRRRGDSGRGTRKKSHSVVAANGQPKEFVLFAA